MERRITKVKWNGKKVEIEYEADFEVGEADEYRVVCKEHPRAEFVSAFDALTIHAAVWLEAPDEEKFRLVSRVTGLGVSWAHGVMGAVLVGKTSLIRCQSPFCWTTPHKTEEPYGDGRGDPEVLLPDATAVAIRRLMSAALAYLDGEREQISLAFDGTSTKNNG